MKLLNRYLNKSEKEENQKNKFDGQANHPINYKPGSTPFEAYLRVRPLFLPEQMRNPQCSIEVLDRESVIFKHEHQLGLKSLTKDKLYRCTKTVPPGGKTSQLLQLGILDLAHDAFNGLNQALFVIGGKDSGKTHTYVGNVADPGLCFSIANTIFQLKDKHYDRSRVYLSCFSFQSNFKDLLSYTGESLEHKSTYNGAYLPGLSQHQCPDMLTYLTYLKTALVVNGKRDINRDFSQAFTLFNPQPEKEIFIIKFTIINILEEKGDNGLDSKESCADLFLIDTESYESLDKIDSKGVNNAMLSFNNCMRTIYEINMGIREELCVHYEQSPFTSFFKEYLGGKAKTYIIGTVSPYSGHLEYSMRTVREVQWAFKSKSNGIMHQEIRIGKQALANEVGYLKIMHNNSVLITQEITMFLKRKNLIEEEEKQKYVEFLGRIFKKYYYINRICNQKIKRILEQRDQIQEICNFIIDLEKSVMKDQLKSPDIKEFFLVKVVPIMYNVVYSKISKAQHNLIRKLRLLKSENTILVMIKKDLKDFIDTFIKKNKSINPNHIEPIYSFSKSFLEHMNWTLYNCFKSFNHPDKSKLYENKLRVEKTIDQNFKRIFTSLNITDYEKYEDKSFAYAGLKLSDLEQMVTQPERERRSTFQPKIPSIHNLRDRMSIHTSSPQGTNVSIRNIDDGVDYNQSLSGIKKQLSSIFDLPSTTLLIKQNQKSKKLQNKALRNASKSQNSLEERGQVDEEESDDEDYDYEIENQDNSIYKNRKYKNIKKITKRSTYNSQRQLRLSVQGSYSDLKNGSGYYIEEDNDLVYTRKSKKSDQEFVHIPRLNPPQIQIQANRSVIKINRKFTSVSPKNNHINNSYILNGSSNINFSNPLSEAANSNRQINFSSHLSDTQQTETIRAIQKLNKQLDGAYLIKDNEIDDSQIDTITFGILKKDIINEKQQDIINEITDTQLLNSDKQKQNQEDDYNEQNSLLNAINSQSNNHNITQFGSDTQMFSHRSYLPSIQSQNSETDKQLLSLQTENMYCSDIQLKSQFNQNLVVNVNLFRNDLENYKLPISINKIFNTKSMSRLKNSENQMLGDRLQYQQQKGLIYDLNTRQIPKIPPKNSIMNRQIQLAAKNYRAEQSLSLHNKNSFTDKNLENKSIYNESLEALVKYSGQSVKRFVTVDDIFDRTDEGPFFTTKVASIKQRILFKKQFNTLRKKQQAQIQKPADIQKIINSNEQEDIEQHQIEQISS